MSTSVTHGVHLLREPSLNKDAAFSIEERKAYGIHGLLPPKVQNQDLQVKRCLENIRQKHTDLDRYIYLMGLQDRNEKLFYKLVTTHVEELMPFIYTPVVGLACQKYGLIFERPRGLFISIDDMGNISNVLKNWPQKKVKVIVVTDGERILGLGDLGCYGMGIPVGKLALYTALAGIAHTQCLPITLDVGTNTQSLKEDPFYIGGTHDRIRGEKYDQFIDEFMRSCVAEFGDDVLIQFEDFGNSNAFRLLEKYRRGYCTFNDDIQGTASVTLAGVLAANRLTKKKIQDNCFLFQGAGEASIGIAKLLVLAMQKNGLSQEEAKKRVCLIDSRGVLVKNRPKGGMTVHKEELALDIPPIDTLEEAVETLKPTVLIGAAAVPGAFSPSILKKMAKFNAQPVIFALSNPTSKAECTAEEAYRNTEGRCIFASGSPFKPVTFAGRTFYPGQGNNAYIFPGVGLAVAAGRIQPIEEEVFIVAAEALANYVSEENLSEGRIFPPLKSIRDVSLSIATAVLEYAYKHKQARYTPEPKDKRAFIATYMYNTDYEDLTGKIPDSKI